MALAHISHVSRSQTNQGLGCLTCKCWEHAVCPHISNLFCAGLLLLPPIHFSTNPLLPESIGIFQETNEPFGSCTWTRGTLSCIDRGQDTGPRPPAQIVSTRLADDGLSPPASAPRMRVETATTAGLGSDPVQALRNWPTTSHDACTGVPSALHWHRLRRKAAVSQHPQPSWTPYVTQSAVIGIKRAGNQQWLQSQPLSFRPLRWSCVPSPKPSS